LHTQPISSPRRIARADAAVINQWLLEQRPVVAAAAPARPVAVSSAVADEPVADAAALAVPRPAERPCQARVAAPWRERGARRRRALGVRIPN
jgi:hypothetical protein